MNKLSPKLFASSKLLAADAVAVATLPAIIDDWCNDMSWSSVTIKSCKHTSTSGSVVSANMKWLYGTPRPTGSYEHTVFNSDVNSGSACRFSALVKYAIHLFGSSLRFGVRYIVSLKHDSNNFNSSARRCSSWEFFGGEWAKPTPASQIYSQLSIFASSSALSGPERRVAVTVKSGQNSKSQIALIKLCANGMVGSCSLADGNDDQKKSLHSLSSWMYGIIRVNKRTQFNAVNENWKQIFAKTEFFFLLVCLWHVNGISFRYLFVVRNVCDSCCQRLWLIVRSLCSTVSPNWPDYHGVMFVSRSLAPMQIHLECLWNDLTKIAPKMHHHLHLLAAKKNRKTNRQGKIIIIIINGVFWECEKRKQQ